ncbi:MAG: ribonuclease P protein component [Pseudomonadota bacterium]
MHSAITTEPSYRFRRNSRLLSAADYGRVFDRAKRSRDSWFTVLYRPRQEGPARLGLAVSKKHCKQAAQRNLIKRLIRESFRRHQHELAGMDIVVLNKPSTHKASRHDLRSSLERHWTHCTREQQKDHG